MIRSQIEGDRASRQLQVGYLECDLPSIACFAVSGQRKTRPARTGGLAVHRPDQHIGVNPGPKATAKR
jgi:hypothetical protein